MRREEHKILWIPGRSPDEIFTLQEGLLAFDSIPFWTISTKETSASFIVHSVKRDERLRAFKRNSVFRSSRTYVCKLACRVRASHIYHLRRAKLTKQDLFQSEGDTRYFYSEFTSLKLSRSFTCCSITLTALGQIQVTWPGGVIVQRQLSP